MIKRKSIILLMVIFLLSAVVIPDAFAEGSAVIKEYSLSELTGMAIANSATLKSAELSKEATSETYDNVASRTAFIPATGLANNDLTAVTTYKLYKNYDIAYELSKKTFELEKDKVRKSVIDYYYEVQNLEKEILYNAKNLEYQKNQMDITRLKANLGLVSMLEKALGERQYNMARDSYNLVQSELDKAYTNLNNLIGLPVGSRYNLKYEDIADISDILNQEDGQYFTEKALANNIILEMAEKSLELKKLSVDYFVFNDLTNPKTYNATKTEYQSEVNSFTSTKDGVEKFVRETFYAAQQIQDNYNKLLLKNTTDEEIHEIKKIQFELGMISKMEFNESENTLLENQANLAALKAAFNETIFVLNYPHVQLG